MKNKRFLILSLVAALSLSSMAGCGDNKDSSSENDSSTSSSSKAEENTIDEEALIKQPVAFYYPTDSIEDATKNDLEAADPTGPADESSAESSGSSSEDESENGSESTKNEDSNNENSGEPATKYITVTEANGEPKTEVVNVTDAEGEKVTDSNGEDVTEVVEVTEAVTDENSNQGGNGNEDKPNNTTDASYEPYMGESYAIWLDISKDADYVFNGEFIEVTFKIKENAPNGVYDVNITNPDLANIYKGGTTVKPDTVVGGKVFIGTEAEKQREFTDDDGFAIYGDYISANPGDEVKFRFYMNNNPGLVAINFHYEFDRNAMDIIDAKSVGEFGDIAKTSFGDSPVLN